jgi:EAL domain-containing protein (putative c-di-GMP-specific phosphodiesterase class I)
MLVEALARWERAYPPVPPDRFVPLAAREGLMRRLSAAVLRRAVAEFAPLRRAAARSPAGFGGVSVNLPLDQLLSPDLPGVLRGALGRSALPPDALALELTETHRVEDRAALERALNRLRRAGHRVMLDDILPDDPRARLFGLPFAGLKLDRSLVAALPRDARLRHALRRITRGAEARGQVVVAEGVSSAAGMALLADLGAHWAQGFAIGRPLPAGALAGWSARWRARGPG